MNPLDWACSTRANCGSARVPVVPPLRGLMSIDIGTFDMWLYTPSTCTARTLVTACETPPVYAADCRFSRLSAITEMLAGAVETNVSGSRPPYGSGYVGLGMIAVGCRKLANSAEVICRFIGL